MLPSHFLKDSSSKKQVSFEKSPIESPSLEQLTNKDQSGIGQMLEKEMEEFEEICNIVIESSA
jgi:hypothetical protein